MFKSHNSSFAQGPLTFPPWVPPPWRPSLIPRGCWPTYKHESLEPGQAHSPEQGGTGPEARWRSTKASSSGPLRHVLTTRDSQALLRGSQNEGGRDTVRGDSGLSRHRPWSWSSQVQAKSASLPVVSQDGAGSLLPHAYSCPLRSALCLRAPGTSSSGRYFTYNASLLISNRSFKKLS